jgi:hypothetical protein
MGAKVPNEQDLGPVNSSSSAQLGTKVPTISASQRYLLELGTSCSKYGDGGNGHMKILSEAVCRFCVVSSCPPTAPVSAVCMTSMQRAIDHSQQEVEQASLSLRLLIELEMESR